MPMNGYGRQGGFLLIAAIILVVVASMLAVTIAMIAATSGSSATDNLQSGQALFLADSGLEFEARRMAQNLDWYRSGTDPTTTSGPQSLGAGTFTTSSNLPATKLRRRLLSGASGPGAAVCVYTIDRFPASGTIQIDDDISAGAEFVTYTGTTASSASCGNLPAFTGLTRGVLIAGTGAAAANHSRSRPPASRPRLCASPTTRNFSIAERSAWMTAARIPRTFPMRAQAAPEA